MCQSFAHDLMFLLKVQVLIHSTVFLDLNGSHKLRQRKRVPMSVTKSGFFMKSQSSDGFLRVFVLKVACKEV